MKNENASIRKFRPGDIFLWSSGEKDGDFIQTIVLIKCVNRGVKYPIWNVLWLRYDGVVEHHTESEAYFDHYIDGKDWTFIPKK